MSKIPLALTAIRGVLALVLVVLAIGWPAHAAFGVCLTVGFLSDVFDGVIARKLGIATVNLRRLDSATDTLFYVAAAFAAWYLYPQVIAEHWVALTILEALELSRYALDIAKFRREASYHMWSAKAWGLVLFTAFFGLLALGCTGAWVAAPIYVGIISDLEGLAVSLVLPEWRADVPSIFHAVKLRKHVKKRRQAPPREGPRKEEVSH
ncbi:CDP-alcohol phosphatidyltransferase family protein [Methylothermus subterraneus]